jgi:hypothetical protein
MYRVIGHAPAVLRGWLEWERFGQKGADERVMTACFHVCVGRFLGSMGIEPEAGQLVTPLPR